MCGDACTRWCVCECIYLKGIKLLVFIAYLITFEIFSLKIIRIFKNFYMWIHLCISVKIVFKEVVQSQFKKQLFENCFIYFELHIFCLQNMIVLCSIVNLKAKCLLVGPGPTRGEPYAEVFLRILLRIYANFGENHGKLRTASSTSATGDWTWNLPSTSFEGRTTRLLVGPR